MLAAMQVDTPATGVVVLLTYAQREEATNTLRSYLGEVYRPPYCGPFKYPTFTVVTRTYKRDDIPRSADVGRRSVGTHSDPTPMEAIANLEGVRVTVPEWGILPYGAMRDLIAAMPAHLAHPLELAIIAVTGTLYGAALDLRMSQTTVFRRCAEALEWLCERIYGERWTGAQTS